jgi:DNA-binding FadR family transcriptional regulator
MDSLVTMMDEDLKNGDTDSFSKSDLEFHVLLRKTSDNRIFIKALESTNSLTYYQQSTINQFPGILESVKARDATKEGSLYIINYFGI